MKNVSFLFLFLFLAVGSLSAQKIPAEFVGEWHSGNVSMMQDKNLTTGQTTASNGSTFTYKFTANGNFEYIGYMKSTMYG